MIASNYYRVKLSAVSRPREEHDRIGCIPSQVLLTLKSGNLVPEVTQVIIKTSNDHRRFTRLYGCFVSTKKDRFLRPGKHYAVEL